MTFCTKLQEVLNHSVLGSKKIHGFIKIYDKIRYLVLYDYEWFDKICDKIKYLSGIKVVLTIELVIIFAKIRIDSYNSLPVEKLLTFHNVIILIKSVVNKNKNDYYYF